MNRAGAGARATNRTPRGWLFAAAIALALTAVGAVHAQDAEPAMASFLDGWRLRLGPSYRQIDGIRIHSAPSYVQQQGLHANGTGNTVVGQVGADSQSADRAYDDGFVTQDAGTANDGNTWFWGYNNASQYHGATPGAETLSFTATNLIGDSVGTNRSFSDEADDSGWGFRLSVDRPVRQVGPFKLVLGVDLSFNQIKANADWEAYRENVYTVTDVYDVSAIAPPGSTTPPFTAPYAGTLTGPGPVISNTPDGGRTLALDHAGRNIVDLDMDIHLVTLAACAGLEKDWGKFRVAGRAGLSLSWAHVSADRDESWFRQMPDGSRQNLGRWSDHSSDDDLIPGALAEFRAEYQLSEQWFVGAAARWDQPFTDVDVKVGPNEVSANLEGVSGSLYLGFSF